MFPGRLLSEIFADEAVLPVDTLDLMSDFAAYRQCHAHINTPASEGRPSGPLMDLAVEIDFELQHGEPV